MYDKSKRVENYKITVGELRKLIEDIPADYKFTVCGSDKFYKHVDTQRKILTLDHDDLDESYDYFDNMEDSIEKFKKMALEGGKDNG